MKITQVAEFVNAAVKQATGAEALVKEDLSNIADAGTAVANANAWNAYLEALINHIGKVVFVDRVYQGSLPKLLRDSWEFGSILEKVSTDLPEANETAFMQPVDGTNYVQNTFTKAIVRAKFFNERLVLEVTCPSITEEQLKQSFSNARQLSSFVNMIFTACENSMTHKIEELIRRVIISQMVATIGKEYGSALLSSKSGVRAVNLLYKYNNEFSESLTVDDCLHDAAFLRYAGEQIRLTIKRMACVSKLFNNEGRDRFTPRDRLYAVMWADFMSATATYLQSNTFHDEMVALPKFEETPYWQGTGLSYDEAGKIKDSLGDIEITGDLKVLGCLFDEQALVVSNLQRYTPSHYVDKMHFWNYWYQCIMGLLRDDGENFVLFFVA